MDCYQDCSPSREALFAIGNVRFVASFFGVALLRHPFKNWLRDNAGQISLSLRFFSPYHT
jgi:hypothetical protein